MAQHSDVGIVSGVIKSRLGQLASGPISEQKPSTTVQGVVRFLPQILGGLNETEAALQSILDRLDGGSRSAPSCTPATPEEFKGALREADSVMDRITDRQGEISRLLSELESLI